jgi:hypothetical protein
MPLRTLSPDETSCTETLRVLGMMTRWEWMAAIDTAAPGVITLRTDRRDDWTDPDDAMRAHWANEGSLIIHHNHPSNESLSCADWTVLLNFPVPEIFAHGTDGSTFYGKLLDRDGAALALANYEPAADAAEAVIIMAAPPPAEALLGLVNLLRKHLVAQGLASKGYVDYQFAAGPIWASILRRHASLLSRGAIVAAGAL